MVRLFLRLWLITSACFILSVLGLNMILDRIYSPMADAAFVQQVRGQVHALRDGLRGRSAEEQRQQLAHWQPHYGIVLTLLDTPPLLDEAERASLRVQRFVVRDSFSWVLLPIDADHGRWLSLRLPGNVALSMHMTVLAYLGVVSVLGACIFIWVRLLWRDLDILRGHADRIGAGDLHARAQVSPRSQIRVIVEHSNRMAARVADLVQGQRDLTHAVSHELRTPVARLAFGLDLVEQASEARRPALHRACATTWPSSISWSANCWPTNAWNIATRTVTGPRSRRCRGCSTVCPTRCARPTPPASGWRCAAATRPACGSIRG